MNNIAFTVHIFKEGTACVAYVPELDLSSCGSDPNEARKNIQDAVRGFLKTSEKMGTLQEVLEEAGYRFEGNQWVAPEFISLDRLYGLCIPSGHGFSRAERFSSQVRFSA